MNNFRKVILSTIFICCLPISCQSQGDLQPQNSSPLMENPDPTVTRMDPSSDFETTICWFEVLEGAKVTCGYVRVPEDRSKEKTRNNTIKLAVAIFHSTSATPAPDPIVYHVGGPGGHMLSIVPYIYERVIAPFLATRDLILFDPRGTGFSQPALECREAETPGDCIRRLFADGHNLYAYNSVSMADDMQDLRTALGYDQWNLLGESYGTHVAQVALREAPDGLRSVIMDSVMPIVLPELPGKKSSFDVSLQRLIDRCEKDRACNLSYPDLHNAIQKAIQHVDRKPVHLQTNCYGEEKSTILTGERLTSMLFSAFYETDFIPEVPYAIAATAEGSDYSFWNKVVCWEVVLDLLLTDGVHWAMQCGDGRLGDECEDWPVAVRQAPITSDIPTLVLSGEFDPVTPLEYGHSVAQSLTHSYVADFPGMGHWVNGTGNVCQSSIVQAFLNNPSQEPDVRCIRTMQVLNFYTPDEADTALTQNTGVVK